MYSTTGSRTRIARFELEGDLTGATGGDLLESTTAGRMDLRSNIPDNASNHNGGTLRFASDGTLIVSVGDDAVPCAAQDSTGNRGLLLRLDASRLAPGFTPPPVALLTPADNPYATSPDSNARLVLARGLRNPFRVQCDAEQPWIVIGDVGENLREELDLLALPSATTPVAGMAAAGANFGWPYLEGTVTGTHVNECAPAPSGLAAPVYDYDRTQQNGASIIPAGFIPEILTLAPQPALPAGLYFSDYYSGALVRLVSTGAAWQVSAPVAGQTSAAHFGEGFREISDWRVRNGELWYARQAVGFAANTGSIGRVVADTLPGPPPDTVISVRVTVEPSPAVGQAVIYFTGSLTLPASLTIHDASGRVRRRYDQFAFTASAGRMSVIWDGLDESGERAPAGVYWARLEYSGRTYTARVPFLR
jgi:hypothetical protein